MSSTILTRAERTAILARCLKNWILIKRCYRYRKLLDLPVPELLDELGVQIYKSLFYYRFKRRLKLPDVPPEEQAYKLALTAGHNALTSMIRTALKRGHLNVVPLDWFNEEHPAGHWTGLRATASPNAIAHVTNLMAIVATEMMGPAKAGALLRATIYVWQGKFRPTKTQLELIRELSCHNRKGVQRLIERYHDRVRAQLDPERVIYLKTEGVWRAAPQVVA